MLILRLTQNSEGDGNYRVEAALEGDGQPRQTATVRFSFALTGQDQEDLRWYLEDGREAPRDSAAQAAGAVERRMAEIGTTLFRHLFQSGDDSRELWEALRARLDDTRVEIVPGAPAAALPWELTRDPQTGTPLALHVRAFVRAGSDPTPRPPPPAGSDGPIRILLALCRPEGGREAPFRSVPACLIRGASDRDDVRLDLLRPPTFAQLAKTLRQARAEDRPYHILHFDGQGVCAEDMPGSGSFRRLKSHHTRPGAHGYLAFETPRALDDGELVDGPRLGRLLSETGVPLLVLNACRSTPAEAPAAPRRAAEGANALPPDEPPVPERAFGSLAQEALDAGAAGVVTLGCPLGVTTAAQFLADLYVALTQGQTLGEAVTQGRRQLCEPLRDGASAPRDRQDWPVPIVYETAPLALFPRQAQAAPRRIELPAAQAMPARDDLDPDLPHPPDTGLFGRDETLCALDRAFDTQCVVLLYAPAGSGKTTMAAEFARWYTRTGGVEGLALYTSLAQKTSLAAVLDKIEQAFGSVLEQAGVRWQALEDGERRKVALQALQQVPVLWIWDDVGPAAELPSPEDAPAAADAAEELADFLRDAQQTQAKFLLIARDEARDWLGDLPARLAVAPLPLPERLALARALVEKRAPGWPEAGPDLREALSPLLAYTQGNPLTLTALVGQALRDRRTTKAQVRAFVAQLRDEEAAFEEDARRGRARSLDAALRYGLEHAFTEQERAILALLHLFQNFVNVDTLRVMGHPEAEWCLPAVRGLTRHEGLALLDRAAEIGLLLALGSGCYSVPPALPWHFQRLFDRYYPSDPSPPEGASAAQARRAFIEAMGAVGNLYHEWVAQGRREVTRSLAAEEGNLLAARRLARSLGLWRQVISAMQGLRVLYDHAGQRAAWKRLVEEIAPEYVAPTTGDPLPGREEKWEIVTAYLTEMDSAARQLAAEERLYRTLADVYRRRAAEVLTLSPETLTPAQRNATQLLGVSLQQLGRVRLRQGEAECETLFQEAYDLALRTGERTVASVFAFHTGDAYANDPERRDLARAARWYWRSLELCGEYQLRGRVQCFGQLGRVAYEQFLEARAAREPEQDQLRHLNAALHYYTDRLDLLPLQAVDELAVTHRALGTILDMAGDVERALTHYREALRCSEAAEDPYGAAETRHNLANLLQWAGRNDEALLYAQTALHTFENCGDRAADIQLLQGLIANLTRADDSGA